MNLTIEQKEFLEHHKIPLRFIFNATGYKPKDYKNKLNELGLLVAIGSLSKNCDNGHKLGMRDRHGRCLECRIANFSFNNSKIGYVYVVGSKIGKVLKVGYSEQDVSKRRDYLNNNQYGGIKDWEILYSAKYLEAGKTEFTIHGRLEKYWFEKSYNHYGKDIKCYELFKCGYKQIKKVINNYNKEIGLINVKDLFELENAESKYNFTEVEKTEKRKGKEDGTINKNNNYYFENNQESKMVKSNKFSELGTGRIIDNIKENIVFYSVIEIQNNDYGIFNLDNECGIANIETGEIMGDSFQECGKIIELNGRFYLNVKKDNKWKIIDIFTNKSLYGDFDYIYEIESDGFVKVKKDGKWKIIDVEDGKVEDCELFVFFELIEIEDKKYIQVIDGIVDLENEEYVGGTFDRVSHTQKIGDEYYFGVFKDINEEENLSGLVSFKDKKLLGEWYDSFDYDFDKYDGDNDTLFINSYLIKGDSYVIFTKDEKSGILNLRNGKKVGKTFDRILEIKEFFSKCYFIFEEDIETGIYSIEKNKIIGPMFSEVIDYLEIGGNIYIKIKDGDEVGYIDLNNEELLGDIYEEISEIQEKNGVLYFSFSYFDGSYGLYDISNNNILNNTDFFDIKSNEKINNSVVKGLKITSGFDNTGNTETINGKQYMPVQIGAREGIYCHTDKIIIGDLYDQLGYTKTSYGEYKDCDINKYGDSYYFTVKNGWKYGNINLETGEFQGRGLFENIMSLLGF